MQLIGWAPNLLSSRKQLRGFYLQDPQLNPVTNDYDYLAYTPVAGDLVRVSARIYNYSTGQSFNNLLVDFQAILYNRSSDTEIPMPSCPNGQPVTNGRCSLGQTSLVSLDPLQTTMAAIVWNTTGFGPSTPGASLQYRIYVVVDPNDTVNEIYAPEDPTQTYLWVDTNGQSHHLQGIDPGQNNEGFGLATVMAATPSPNADTAPDVFLAKGSLAALDSRDGALHTDLAHAALGQPTPLRVSVYADRSHREFSHLLVYGGDPRKGGLLIADKIAHSGNPQGTQVWIDWTPCTPGLHRIVARVVKDHDDPIPDNGEDIMLVQVRPDAHGPKARVAP